jgi:hypothetical protein
MNDEIEKRHVLRGRWVLYGFLVIAGFFLFEEHRAHVLGALPYLLLLACPLMHLFMHHNHENHDQQKHDHGSTKGELK